MMADRSPTRARFSVTRTFAASLDEVWSLWTTPAGIESWWGPAGFEVAVTSLELRAAGRLVYLMTAVAADTVAFMKKAGMPLSTQCTVTYTEVKAPHRLAFTTLADFVPGIEAYEVATVVEFVEVTDGVRIVITFDAMHDDVWTERARAGHEGQLRKLDELLVSRRHRLHG